MNSRTLVLRSPHMKGEDVLTFQGDLNGRYHEWGVNRRVGEDSDYGKETRDAAHDACIALGILPEVAMKDGAPAELRSTIRHPERRTAAELARSKSMAATAFRAHLRKKFAAPRGVEIFDGHQVAAWIVPSLRWARQHGWTGTVSSGFRTCAHQTAVAKVFAASQGLTLAQVYPHGPCASNHVGHKHPAGAVDVTNAAQLNDVLRKNPHRPGLVWGGPVINDEVHFSANGH